MPNALILLALLASASTAHPNILLLVGDDIGVDKMSFYQEGQSPPSTPRLAALAESGVLFRNVWSNPLCAPTRACYITGRHIFRTGVSNSFVTPSNSLRPSETTLPEILADAGYASCLTGKFFLGVYGGSYAPQVVGFEHFSGTLGGGILNYYHWLKTVDGHANISKQYATSANVDDAIEWIDAHQSRNWFCCVSFNTAHEPLHAPPKQLHTVNLRGLEPTKTPIPFYNAMVEAMDTEIGRLLDHLHDQLDNTVVIFTTDNGSDPEVTLPPFDPDHAKGTAYEGSVNVPLIVSGPIVTNPGREVSGLVQLVDLFATIAELTGADASTGVDSVSLVPYLENASQAPIRKTVYTELYSQPLPCRNGVVDCVRAVRNERYKLIHKIAYRKYELYDLANDPFEQKNLIRSRAMAVQNEHKALKRVLDSFPTGGGSLFR